MRAGVLHETTPARVHEADGVDEANRADVNRADDRAAKVARLELVRPGIRTAASLAHERTVPVVAGLHELVPSGALQRGSTVAVHGQGAVSFALALAGEASRSGSFLAVVAPSTFNLGVCLDFGVPLRRVVQFVLPHDTGAGAGWAQLVAAVIEGFDLTLVADPRRISAAHARGLTARARERGAIMVRAGGPSWPDAPDLRYDVHEPTWHGLGEGHGHVQARTVSVRVAGRRWPGAPRERHLRLTGDGVEPVVLTQVAATPAAPAMPATSTVPLTTATPGRHAGSDIDHLIDAGQEEAGRPQADRPVSTPAAPDQTLTEPRRVAFGTVA